MEKRKVGGGGVEREWAGGEEVRTLVVPTLNGRQWAAFSSHSGDPRDFRVRQVGCEQSGFAVKTFLPIPNNHRPLSGSPKGLLL